MTNIYFKKILSLLILQILFLNINSKTVTQTIYKTEIPPFGNIEFSGTVNLETKKYSLKGVPTQKIFDIGVLQIQKPLAAISNTKGLTLEATISLFNQTGTLAIEEFVPKGINKRTLFSIAPAKPITFKTPWKTINLDKFSLLITPKTKELITTASLLGVNTQISFGKNKTTNNNYAKIFFENLSPSKLGASKSNLDFVDLQNVTVKIENPFKKGVKHPTTMSGIINIKLPGKLGAISSEFNSEYKKGKFEISVKTQKPINIDNGKIKLENTGVKVSSTGELTISGDANIFNTDITGYLTFKKLTPEEKAEPNITKIGNYKLEFLGKAKDSKTIKPFINFKDLPNKIKNIEIKNTTIGLKSDKQFYLSGNIKILGFESIAEINIQGNKQASLKIKPPQHWVKENLLKGEIFNQLDIVNTYILISSHSYRDEELDQNINKGFNLISGVQILKDTQLNTLLGNIKQKLLLIGSFGSSLTDINLAVALPITVKLSNNITLQNISLAISGQGEMGIKSQIKLNKPKLIFTGYFGVDPKTTSVEAQGTMQGKWKNPLGIKGISISDTAVEFAIATTPPTPVPTKVGITGKLNIGNVQGEAAIKIDVTGQGGIIAKLNKLTLKDLLTIPAKLTPKVDWNKLQKRIPKISISNVDIKAAVVPFKIGEIAFEPGINLKGEAKILDKFKAMINCSVGSDGIIAKGTASTITIGKILTITGAGLDGVYGNKDDGPTVDFQLTSKKQELMISGMGKLAGIKGKTDLYIGKKEIKFEMTYDIMGSGMTLEGKSKGNIKNLNSLDFKIYGQFKNELTQYIANQIKEKLGSVAGAIASFYGTAIMPLKISKVQLWTSFKELIKGELPRARIDIKALGKTFTIDEQLDLKKPHKMIWHLTKSILNGIEQFITNLPANIAKRFSKAKNTIFNTSKEIINAIQNGNVIFYNDTKYKIKIKIKRSAKLGFSTKSYEIVIPANDVLGKFLQKDLRDMQLYIEKNGKWILVNAWPGNSNIIDTYDYKTVYLNFGYFPDDEELEKKYQTKQNFRRRIREGNTVIKDWFSKQEKKQRKEILTKKELIKKWFKKYLKRNATSKEISKYLNWYPKKYSGIIDKSKTDKIEETDKSIEKNIKNHPERKKRKINEWFIKYYKRKPNEQEFQTIFNNWDRDEIIKQRIKSSAPQNRKKTIAKWIEQYTNRKAKPGEIEHYLKNWIKFKGLQQVQGRIRNSQAAIDSRKKYLTKWFEKYHNRKPTKDELKEYAGTGGGMSQRAYKLWQRGFKEVKKIIKEL